MSGIYIHIPFCKQACHYCDFHFSTSMGKKEAMVVALQRELELRKTEFKDELVQTIYFGGGTPSVLTPEEIKSIIDAVYQHYEVAENPEITLEANPDDLTIVAAPPSIVRMTSEQNSVQGANHRVVEQSQSNVFQDYKKIGINRLSIGIQSFFDVDLEFMNRAHSASEAEVCLSEAVRYFDNISIDLIYGIPGMDNGRWRQNIEKALSYDIPHISSYALTVEPKTALAEFIKKGSVQPLSDDLAQMQYDILNQTLEKEGYSCYEISNFGKPGYFSQNNTGYWHGKKYMGIGPSAHSYDGRNRGWNIRNNAKYIKAIGADKLPIETETLSMTDRYNEYVMTGLRTIWGVSLSRIESEYGLKYREYVIMHSEKYLKEELLQINDDILLTTKKGRFLADGIAADLFMVNLP